MTYFVTHGLKWDNNYNYVQDNCVDLLSCMSRKTMNYFKQCLPIYVHFTDCMTLSSINSISSFPAPCGIAQCYWPDAIL